MEEAEYYPEVLKRAKEAEEAGDTATAIELYEKAIKQKPVLEQSYNRLMILYRKGKDYKKELRVIDKALDVFTDLYDKKKKAFSGSGKVAQLSKALLKTIGGKMKDGDYYPEPVPKWLKRKAVVEKKIK